MNTCYFNDLCMTIITWTSLNFPKTISKEAGGRSLGVSLLHHTVRRRQLSVLLLVPGGAEKKKGKTGLFLSHSGMSGH